VEPKVEPKADEPTVEDDSVPKEDTRDADTLEKDTDSKPTDNPRTTEEDIPVDGTFASKETPRVTSVMADGIAYVRELAENIIHDTHLADKAPIITLAISLAEWAEVRLRAFTGTEKKEMVLNLLLWAIENQEDVLNNVLGENEDELYRLVRDVVPSVLDVVCAAAKGKLDLNKMVNATNSCLGWCFGDKKA
jgi:hypothetical protein